MILRFAAAVFAVALATSAAIAADPLSFDDPGMHFRAPDGWERVDLGDAAGTDNAPAAVFALRRDRADALAIIIKITDFDGSLEGFVNQRRSELRSGGDNVTTFLLKQTPLTLDNGMPAFLITSESNVGTGSQHKTFEYLIIDGKRGIDVRYTGLVGDVDDDVAKRALSSLYVVAYPTRRQ